MSGDARNFKNGTQTVNKCFSLQGQAPWKLTFWRKH